jgi:hypothetical protein
VPSRNFCQDPPSAWAITAKNDEPSACSGSGARLGMSKQTLNCLNIFARVHQKSREAMREDGSCGSRIADQA